MSSLWWSNFALIVRGCNNSIRSLKGSEVSEDIEGVEDHNDKDSSKEEIDKAKVPINGCCIQYADYRPAQGTNTHGNTLESEHLQLKRINSQEMLRTTVGEWSKQTFLMEVSALLPKGIGFQ